MRGYLSLWHVYISRSRLTVIEHMQYDILVKAVTDTFPRTLEFIQFLPSLPKITVIATRTAIIKHVL